MVDVAQLEAPLDITQMEAVLECARPDQSVQVPAMTFEELAEAARAPGFTPRWKTCTPCVRWVSCWHRVAEDRLTAVQAARKAAQVGQIPVVSAQVAALAGKLLPAGVRVAHLGQFSNEIERVCVGDYLELRIPLPGVVYDQDGHGEVIEKRASDGVVSLTVARTNSPGAEPTTYYYPARCIVTARRAVGALA